MYIQHAPKVSLVPDLAGSARRLPRGWDPMGLDRFFSFSGPGRFRSFSLVQVCGQMDGWRSGGGEKNIQIHLHINI